MARRAPIDSTRDAPARYRSFLNSGHRLLRRKVFRASEAYVSLRRSHIVAAWCLSPVGQYSLPKARQIEWLLSIGTGYETFKLDTASLTLASSFSKPNSGAWTPITTSPASLYFAAQAFIYGGSLKLLMHEYVQKSDAADDGCSTN